MKEKASRKLANGQNIDYSEKENGPRASSAPALGLDTIIFKHVYWYMLQISGERLQDHWSSGFSLSPKTRVGGSVKRKIKKLSPNLELPINYACISALLTLQHL